MNNNKHSVYKHILSKKISDKDNDMIYIGITAHKPEKRWSNGHGYKNNPYFWRAIQKYGWNNFKHEILFEGLTKEEAEQKEIELIAYYRSNCRDYGYNISNGGDCLGKHSEETKQKMKDNHKDVSRENHPMYGKHHSDDTKQKISQKAKERCEENGSPFEGKVHSEQTKLAMSEIAKERFCISENNPFYGKHHTEKTKNSLSKKAKERLKDKTKHPNYGNTKKVICLDDNVVYPSVSYVSEKFELSMAALYRVCAGINDRCGGYRFRYLDLVEKGGELANG